MTNKKEVSVDIGFMVFNKKTYPNLINFFSENKIAIEKSDMSFSVSVEWKWFRILWKRFKWNFFK